MVEKSWQFVFLIFIVVSITNGSEVDKDDIEDLMSAYFSREKYNELSGLDIFDERNSLFPGNDIEGFKEGQPSDRDGRRVRPPNSAQMPPFDVQELTYGNFKWEKKFCKKCLLRSFKKVVSKCYQDQLPQKRRVKRDSSYNCWWCSYCTK